MDECLHCGAELMWEVIEQQWAAPYAHPTAQYSCPANRAMNHEPMGKNDDRVDSPWDSNQSD